MPGSPQRPAFSRRDFTQVAIAALVTPFIGGAALDGALPPRYDRRRVERVSALLRPDAGEPRATLFTDQWRQARERAPKLHRGAVWRRLLDHQERGWEYVRPLALAVEEGGCWTAEKPTVAGALYLFADLEIVDLYRHNAFRCVDMVLAPQGTDVPSTDDIEGDTDAFYRNVSLLRLASADRKAPPEFRVLANHAAGLDAWYREFAGIFEPAAEALHRRLTRMGFWAD